MKSISELRRENALALIAKDETISGLTDFAKKIGKAQAYVSNILGENPKRNIGNQVAREIEKYFNIQSGWLDYDHSVKIPAYSIQAYEDISEVSSEHAKIPVYQIELSAGTGATAPEFVETVYELPFRLDWVLSEGVKPENTKVMKVKGDSMLTTLGNGDKVLIDVGCRLVEDNRVYAIVLNDDVYVKRLFRTYNGGLDIVSDNEDFDKVTIPPDELHYVYIIGRVFHKMGNSGL